MRAAASPGTSALLPLFFLSGAASLIFENLWQRQMTHVFGASAPSTTVILTSFFLGMALGSLLGGRLLNRLQHRVPTLRLYAATELWIGITGAAVPLLLRGVDALYLSAFAAHDAAGAFAVAYRFLMCAAVALPASIGMGATIPIMSRLLAEHGHAIGRSVGLAYGVNTLGAVSGCLAGTFALLPALGIQRSLFAASGLNALLVTLALLLSRGRRPLPVASQLPDAIARRSGLLIGLYALAGFLAIGFEVTWLRLIAIFSSNGLTTFTFSLSVYLSGFALGSLALFPLLERRLSGVAIFFCSNFGLALSSLAVLGFAQEVHYALWALVEGPISQRGSLPLWTSFFELASCASILLVPSVFMGLAFPAVCQACTEARDRIASTSGAIYFFGNLGSTAGAFVTGLWLIPRFGLDASLGLLTALASLLGLLALALAPIPRRPLLALACAGVAAASLSVSRGDRPYFHVERVVREGEHWRFVDAAGRPQPMTLLRNTSGPSATVTVREWRNHRSGHSDRMIYIDDQAVAATQRWSKVDSKMLAHLPLLLHPDPKLALTVGFGSGGTSWSMVTHGVRTDVAEIEPEVVRSASLFESQNHRVLESPLLRVVLNDARNHLYTTSERYDVISTDVTNLQYKQNGSLYTEDYFRLMQSRLTPNGIACAWVPFGVEDDELAVLMATWQAVYPHASFWFFDQTKTTFAIFLGTPQPLRIDYARLKRGFAIPAVREDLAEIGVYHPLHLAHFLYLDEHAWRKFTGDAPLHTDDHPILEFRSHYASYRRDADMRARFRRLAELRPETLEPWIDGIAPEELPELRRVSRFARAWGDFVNHKNIDPDGLRGRPEFYERGVRYLETALEAVPDYERARRELEVFRRKLEAESAG